MNQLDLEQFSGATKGPWKWKLVDEDDPEWQLCEVYWGDIDENADDSAGGYIATGGIGIANAKLIAAAPRLLAELKALRVWRQTVNQAIEEVLYNEDKTKNYHILLGAWGDAEQALIKFHNAAEKELKDANV